MTARRSITFTPYRFAVELDLHRDAGRIPNYVTDPVFDMFLLDGGRGIDAGSPQLVERCRRLHPLGGQVPRGVSILCTDAELDRWTQAQKEALASLRDIDERTNRRLDEGSEPGTDVVQRCRVEMRAVALRLRRATGDLEDRLADEVEERRYAWARRERERIGRGYASGGFGI